jgi:serine/threonine protein kinase
LCIHYRLHHPHIARIRDAFLSRDLGHKVLNIVMEFVQGGTLIDYVNTHRPVSETTARYPTVSTRHSVTNSAV